MASQEMMIYPKLGVEGIDIRIDTTNIQEVVKKFGKNFQKKEWKAVTYYTYKEQGITFAIDPYDANDIVRSIILQAPFQGKTTKGIVLGKTILKEAADLYDKGYFTSNYETIVKLNGISFFSLSKKKGKLNTKGIIYKIEINNDGDFGIPSRTNYTFNTEKSNAVFEDLKKVLISKDVSQKKIDSLFDYYKKNKNRPFIPEVSKRLSRQIEDGISQEIYEVSDRGRYQVQIFSTSEKILSVSVSKPDGALWFENNLNSNINTRDLTNLSTFGTFCGFAGAPPRDCRAMLTMVKNESQDLLKSWLYSKNLELAAYGYVGLSFLAEKVYLRQKTKNECSF